MIVITAILKAKQGKENELIGGMKSLAEAVNQNEPGCLEYRFHRSQKDPSVFMVYEKYESGKALQAHMTAPYFQEAAKKFPEILDGDMSIETYEFVA